MKAYFDTAFLVAASVGDHPHHSQAIAALRLVRNKKIVGHVSGHSPAIRNSSVWLVLRFEDFLGSVLGRNPTKELAEEEGFDFPQYEGDNRWYSLVCYTRKIDTKEFTLSRINTGMFPAVIRPVFVACVSRYEKQSLRCTPASA